MKRRYISVTSPDYKRTDGSRYIVERPHLDNKRKKDIFKGEEDPELDTAN